MSEPIRIASRLDRVAVYRAGALVTRVAELPSDAERVLLGPLPLGIHDGSLRVAARGAVASGVRVVLEVPPLDLSLPPARPEELEDAQHEVARLRDRLDQLRRRAARIESVGVVTRPAPRPGREPAPSPARARMALLDLRERFLASFDEERQRIARELRDAERRLADLRDRDLRASSARRPEPHELRKAAVISLSSATAGAVLELTYRVDAARWAPSYVLRLDRELARGTLELRAVVSQLTGEDWDGVALSLSTAELRGWAELPELASIRIGRRQPPLARVGWRPAPADTSELYQDYDRAKRPVAIPASAGEIASETVFDLPTDARTTPPPMRAPMAAPAAPAYYGAPPMPPPSMAVAPPMQAAPEALRARAKSAPVLGAIGDLLRGGSGGPVLEEEMTAFADAEPLEPPPAALSARDAMLDYGMLHMPGPDGPSRGKLVLRTREEIYVAIVREASLEIDVAGALASVDATSRAVLAVSLPPGCELPIRPSGFDYVYRAEGRAVAPSDGVFHNLALRTHEGDARVRFVVVPRESRDAFRYVEMDNPLDAPLLAGPIDVYAGGAFMMSAHVRDVPPRGVLRLGLGVDQRLKVSRNARFKEKSAGLMGGRLDLMHEVDVELESHLSTGAEVEVRERIPVKRDDDDDVEVIVGNVEPPWEAWEPHDDETLQGGHRWRIRLGPGEKKKLVSRYVIRIASKHELAGGNRREA